MEATQDQQGNEMKCIKQDVVFDNAQLKTVDVTGRIYDYTTKKPVIRQKTGVTTWELIDNLYLEVSWIATRKNGIWDIRYESSVAFGGVLTPVSLVDEHGFAVTILDEKKPIEDARMTPDEVYQWIQFQLEMHVLWRDPLIPVLNQ
jgi:protein tyrosine/serine phosphatase